MPRMREESGLGRNWSGLGFALVLAAIRRGWRRRTRRQHYRGGRLRLTGSVGSGEVGRTAAARTCYLNPRLPRLQRRHWQHRTFPFLVEHQPLFAQVPVNAEHVPQPHLLGRQKRSEEHTSELQSRLHLVCRLLLEKKKRYSSNSRRRSTHHCCLCEQRSCSRPYRTLTI